MCAYPAASHSVIVRSQESYAPEASVVTQLSTFSLLLALLVQLRFRLSGNIDTRRQNQPVADRSPQNRHC